MSDARTKLLEAVPKIDAALEHAATAIEAAAPMSAQAYISEARYFLSRLYSQALRAHASPPAATEPVGEVVEVAVWEDPDDGDIRLVRPGGKMDSLRLEYVDWRRLGVVRLPVVPVIPARVEPAK
jgi:hypothetical protein